MEMDDTHIVEVWTTFKEYLDKKSIHAAAERYVDLLADMGVDDHTFTEILGSDAELDDAINYYLDLEETDDDDDDDMYEE
jgi:hypothetical protein